VIFYIIDYNSDQIISVFNIHICNKESFPDMIFIISFLERVTKITQTGKYRNNNSDGYLESNLEKIIKYKQMCLKYNNSQ